MSEKPEVKFFLIDPSLYRLDEVVGMYDTQEELEQALIQMAEDEECTVQELIEDNNFAIIKGIELRPKVKTVRKDYFTWTEK